MDSESRLVAVVDDDQPVRKALTRLLQSADYRAETYASGPEFVRSLAERMPACLVLDIRMQGMSGFDVQAWLAEQGVALPIVFITAVDDAEELALASPNGLRSRATAPLPMASATSRGSSSAVMKTIGSETDCSLSQVWTSNPVMPCMRMSSTRQSGTLVASDLTNSAPEAKDST